MSCLHIEGTRRTGNSAPLSYNGKKDRALEVAQNAKHKNPMVRATAAASPHASQELLFELAGDDEAIVREWVARNTVTQWQTLWCLAVDEHAPIRAFVAWNPNVSNKTLEGLARDEDSTVRQVAKMVLDNRQ